ncbi:MAG: hypothetical protein EOO75_08045 [Myxococcales bacterium]|nr:MAG: hypothetical protein EOO75_08045 [Myxococcales bacterium]
MIESSRLARARRQLVTVVLVGAQAGVALTTTTPAQAQAASPDKEAKRKAGARFKEGEALFQKHAYDEAARAFEEAQAIAPHPSVLLNAINAHMLAGHQARAASS